MGISQAQVFRTVAGWSIIDSMLATLDFGILNIVSWVGFVIGIAGLLTCIFGIYELIKAKSKHDRDSAFFFIFIGVMFGSILLAWL